jgi:methylmalonyl-CoA/ethylmalonyl-CoA epimerase
MIRVRRVDHVAIAVADLTQFGAQYARLLGAPPPAQQTVAAQKTAVAFFQFDSPQGEPSAGIELIAPCGNPPLERFVAKGGGLHHLALEVECLDEALATLKAAGVPLVDEVAREGARGHRVAFLHPRATGGVLIELVERGK